MSDDIFDGLSNFMRPIVSGRYVYEPKTNLPEMKKTKLPEMKWRDATPEEIALSALGQMNNEPMTATEVLARQKEAYEKPDGALAPLTAAHVAWLEKLVRPPVGSAFINQPFNTVPGCLTRAADPFAKATDGVLWEDEEGNLDSQAPTPRTGNLRSVLQRLAEPKITASWVRPEFVVVVTENTPVTDEMIAAARVEYAPYTTVDPGLLERVYRAMAALAPKVSEGFQARLVEAILAPKDREILMLRAEREAWKHMYEELRGKADVPDAGMLRADETGNHNYHGPTKDGNAVPDPVHERAHEVVGDILGGRIIRPARDQMEKALADARVKDGKTPAEIPTTPNLSDPRRIGG